MPDGLVPSGMALTDQVSKPVMLEILSFDRLALRGGGVF